MNRESFARYLLPVMLGLLLLASGTEVRAGEGRIAGRVSLTDPQGTVINGDGARVFLTTEAAASPPVDLESVDAPLGRRTRINNGHMDFFINFQKRQNAAGFLIDHKLTRPDGIFAFYHIPAGR